MQFATNQKTILLPESLNQTMTLGNEFSGFTLKGNNTLWTAAATVTEWQEENGLWKAPLPEDHSSLYRNGKKVPFSRWPKKEYITCSKWEHEWNSEANKWNFNRMHIALPEELCEALNQSVLSAYFGWMNNRWTDFKADPEGISLNPENRQLAGHCKFFFEKLPLKYLEPGEWLPQEEQGFFYYKPLPGETFKDAEFTTSGTKTILTIDGAENITFEDITFSCNGDSSLDCGKQADILGSAAIVLKKGKNCTFRNCRISNVARWGIVMENGCCGNRIENCTFEHLGSGAIRIEGENSGTVPEEISEGNTIESCRILHGGQHWGCCAAILITDSAKNTVRNCDISYFPYSGISCGWTWDYKTSPAYANIIDSNTVHDLGHDHLLIDMGGIYLLGDQPGTMVTNNHVYNIVGDSTVFGIYLDEGSSNISILRNIVHDCTSEPFHVHYGKHNLVTGNIFAASPGSPAVGFTRGTMNFKNEFVPGDKVCWFNRNLCIANGMTIYMKYLLEIEGKQEMLDSWAGNNNVCVQLAPGKIAAACDDYHDFFKTYREIPDEEFISPERDSNSLYLKGRMPEIQELPEPLKDLYEKYLRFQKDFC